MNSTKDYNNRLPTEEEIKKSLDRYFGFLHSKINTLADGDILKIIKMQDKGWNMKSSKEEINKLIEDFVNIYGFIYKDVRKNGAILIRGTTTDEAKQMRKGGEISSILSTTTNENIAKRFCEYENAALIRIKANVGLPYVYVEDFKEDLDNEEEVLILPFSKIENTQFTSNWDGYKYYDVTLEKAELPEISDEKLEELRGKCIEEYNDFSEKLKDYELESDYEKKIELRKELQNYKSQFREMLKGLCKQREKDIDLQKQDKRKIREEIRIGKLKKGIQQFEEILTEDFEIVHQNTQANVSDLINTINKFKQMSNILGIKTFDSQNLEYDLIRKSEQISESKQPDVTEPDLDKKYGILLDTTQKYGTAKKILQEMPELLQDYNNNSIADLKMSLNKKVQEMIYRTAYYRLDDERHIVLSQKENVLSKLSGKTLLNEAKVRNIEARMNYAYKRSQTSNPSNSINQILCDIYECAYEFNGGSLTPEMQQIEESIRKIFSNIPDQKSLATQAFVKQLNELPVIQNKKTIFSLFRNRQAVKRLDNKTLLINEKVNNISVPVRENTKTNLINIYSRYNEILEKVGKLIEEKERKETQVRDTSIEIIEER